jgi:hypothetical protein
MSSLPVVRDDKGRFIPGQSGNPEGKAKGLKNYITHERLMLESALRDYVGKPEQAQKLLDGISRVLDIATLGENKDAISAMKLLLDRVMPAMPIKEAEEAESTDRRLEIIIRTNPNAKVPVQAVIDGDYTEIEEPPCQTKRADNPRTQSKAEKEPTRSTTKATKPSPKTSAKKSDKVKPRSRKTKPALSK